MQRRKTSIEASSQECTRQRPVEPLLVSETPTGMHPHANGEDKHVLRDGGIRVLPVDASPGKMESAVIGLRRLHHIRTIQGGPETFDL